MARPCGHPDAVAFSVPEGLRRFAPGEAAHLAICPVCLALIDAPAPPADEPDFSEVDPVFPAGRAGAEMALAVGLLADSLALNREGVVACFESLVDAGVDPWLVLERLSGGPDRPRLDRERRQLEQLFDA